MDKACKSNGMGIQAIVSPESGERVSNTWVTYHRVGDNPGKPGLIPHTVGLLMADRSQVGILRDLPPGDWPAAHSLVGGVTAHQGDDG